ncbi:MAG: asparagine synthase (glutamine-hydrolyzing) [Chlorobiales bacterium]|nr:asparagine synthase (glutamine-hydrolyzing) [Chlorobiales bacterium]
MCGFAGFIGYGSLSAPDVRTVSQRMGETILHRGPDDSGIWIDDDALISIVHRRLSILDLSPAGHQPMISASGRYVLAFNGEIYNHDEMRMQMGNPLCLADHQGRKESMIWKGHSDTETLLACFEQWGFELTLTRSIGMFALALWDRAKRTLYLARDRMGEKPLYYGWQENVFFFASELKALKIHPDFRREIDHNAITLQLRHSYIPAPYSIYKGIQKLSPGCHIKIKEPLRVENKEIHPVAYWSLSKHDDKNSSHHFAGDEREASDALDQLLRDAVMKQMAADVPLGAFLSGGIDSSTIVALMQAQSSIPVKTFSIGFYDADYNEANHAMAVARHLGTDHTEMYVTSDQAMAVIPKLPLIYDEPFSDDSQIPTYLLSEMAKQDVTVSLSGDAGDELFGGYNRYFLTHEWWNRINRVPLYMRRLIADGLDYFSPASWNRADQMLSFVVGKKSRRLNLHNKIGKISRVLKVSDSSELYRNFTSHWSSPETVVLNGCEPADHAALLKLRPGPVVEQMMLLDKLLYLPDDILVKVDRAAMSVSLETRVPFLDHRVVEFASSIPFSMKINNGKGKWILRQVLYNYVPEQLIERPKKGFGLPIDKWLRGPLREWAESLLDESRLVNDGYLNPHPVRLKWKEHLEGKHNWQHHLWDILMFGAWLEKERETA